MGGLVKLHSPENPSVADARSEGGADIFREIEAAPSEELPVFRSDPETGLLVEGRLRWGLIPHWMKARPDIQPIHARAETVANKKMFSDAYAKRRCIVPMDSFHERDKRRKIHEFGMKDGTPFAVAGIWENWRNPRTERCERTFAIITVLSNTLVAQIHDRMPAILRNEDLLRWLGPEPDLRDLLVPYPTELMRKLR